MVRLLEDEERRWSRKQTSRRAHTRACQTQHDPATQARNHAQSEQSYAFVGKSSNHGHHRMRTV
eukprot:4399335-Pleurochrysis_carterae.AAC.1